MKTMRRQWRLCVGAVLLAAFMLAENGCGNATNSSSTGVGSSASTVGGSSVSGSVVKVDLTTSRTKIAKGDVVLIAVRITCSQVSGNCPLTDATGQPYFAARPYLSTGTDSSSIDITANYNVNSAGKIVGTDTGTGTQTLTLPAGTAAVYTAGVLTTPAVLGGVTSAVNFTIQISGLAEGLAILTVQSFNTVASIGVDVTNNTSAILK